MHHIEGSAIWKQRQGAQEGQGLAHGIYDCEKGTLGTTFHVYKLGQFYEWLSVHSEPKSARHLLQKIQNNETKCPKEKIPVVVVYSSVGATL